MVYTNKKNMQCNGTGIMGRRGQVHVDAVAEAMGSGQEGSYYLIKALLYRVVLKGR